MPDFRLFGLGFVRIGLLVDPMTNVFQLIWKNGMKFGSYWLFLERKVSPFTKLKVIDD